MSRERPKDKKETSLVRDLKIITAEGEISPDKQRKLTQLFLRFAPALEECKSTSSRVRKRVFSCNFSHHELYTVHFDTVTQKACSGIFSISVVVESLGSQLFDSLRKQIGPRKLAGWTSTPHLVVVIKKATGEDEQHILTLTFDSEGRIRNAVADFYLRGNEKNLEHEQEVTLEAVCGERILSDIADSLLGKAKGRGR